MKKRIILVVQFIITILLLIYLFQRFELSFSKQSLNFLNPLWLIFPVYFAVIFIPILAASRWRILLFFVGINANIYKLMKINFVSIFWGTFLPSGDGFAVIRMYQIEKKFPASPGQASSSIILEKLFGFMHLCLFGFVFSFFINDFPQITVFRLILLGFLLILLIVLALLIKTNLINSFQFLLKKFDRGSKISDYFRNLQDCLKNIPILKAILASSPLILLIQTISFLNVYLIFKTLDLDVPIIFILASMPIIQIISLIPVTLSGFGLREGAFIYFFSHIGIPVEIAFSVSIINFAVLTGLPAAIGGFLSLNGQLRRRENLR